MINYNGKLVAASQVNLSVNNRGFNYGDAIFETIRVNQGKILFWEDHYFRLMAGMRILRMEIPMKFTPEFFQTQITDIVEANKLSQSSARIKFVVHREEGGLYTPDTNGVSYVILVSQLSTDFYTIEDQLSYKVELYKDHYIAPDLISTLKTNNKIVNVLGSIYAKENGFDNCLLLNSDKKILEALNGNLFLVKGNHIKTPPTSDGCLKGILRTQLLRIVEKLPEYTIEEGSISPFELQKADELFVTNVIKGIQPIYKFRKKNYDTTVSKRLLGVLNAQIRLGN